MLDDTVYALTMMGQSGIEFGSSALTAGGTTTVSKPTGVTVGDVVFVWALDVNASTTLTTTSGSAWSAQDVAINAGSTSGNSTLFWKVLDATDVANAWTLSDATGSDATLAIRYIGNGADAVAIKDTEANGIGTTTLSLTGFAKAAGHYGVVAFFGAPNDAGVGGIVAPTGFAERRRDSSGAPDFAAIIVDRLGGYVDGAAVQFTNCDATATESGILVEVTGP